MYKKNISKLRFENYLAKELVFEINPSCTETEELELNLKFNHEMQLDYQQNKAVIILECSLFEEADKNNYPFSLKLSLLGFFNFDTDLKEEEIIKLLEVNGTAILFPYLRSIITTVTSNIGVPPVIIPTMNIVEMLRNNKKD